MFCFLQLHGFWCDLLESDDTTQPLLNYTFWLILAFYLFMLKGQAVLGNFIVVFTENTAIFWVCRMESPCSAHLCLRGLHPWLYYPLGHGASRQYPVQPGGLGRQAASAGSALEVCGTSSPLALQGQSLAFRLAFCLYFVSTLFMVYQLFPWSHKTLEIKLFTAFSG